MDDRRKNGKPNNETPAEAREEITGVFARVIRDRSRFNREEENEFLPEEPPIPTERLSVGRLRRQAEQDALRDLERERVSAVPAEETADADIADAKEETPDAADRDTADNSFRDEVFALKAEDMAPSAPPHRKRGVIASIVRYVLLYVCLTALFVSLLMIGNSLINYRRASAVYDDISAYFNNKELPEGAVPTEKREAPSAATPDFEASLHAGESDPSDYAGASDEDFEMTRAKLNYLATRNPDLYGWIRVDGTPIDYPLVQTDNNDFYLDNDFYGQYLPEGSIFVDFRCERYLPDNRNTVIYGHNMLNDSMFGTIPNFLKKSFFEENRYITVTTFDGIYVYEIFAIYQTDMYYSYIQTEFGSDEEFLEFAERMRDNSVFVRDDVTFTPEDRILTLSTCTNGYYIYRYALQARLVSATESDR